jgi:hypothetical protein
VATFADHPGPRQHRAGDRALRGRTPPGSATSRLQEHSRHRATRLVPAAPRLTPSERVSRWCASLAETTEAVAVASTARASPQCPSVANRRCPIGSTMDRDRAVSIAMRRLFAHCNATTSFCTPGPCRKREGGAACDCNRRVRGPRSPCAQSSAAARRTHRHHRRTPDRRPTLGRALTDPRRRSDGGVLAHEAATPAERASSVQTAAAKQRARPRDASNRDPRERSAPNPSRRLSARRMRPGLPFAGSVSEATADAASDAIAGSRGPRPRCRHSSADSPRTEVRLIDDPPWVALSPTRDAATEAVRLTRPRQLPSGQAP